MDSKVYKIRNKVTGLFKDKEGWASFTPNGQVYGTVGHARSGLTAYCKRAVRVSKGVYQKPIRSSFEIVEFVLKETQTF